MRRRLPVAAAVLSTENKVAPRAGRGFTKCSRGDRARQGSRGGGRGKSVPFWLV